MINNPKITDVTMQQAKKFARSLKTDVAPEAVEASKRIIEDAVYSRKAGQAARAEIEARMALLKHRLQPRVVLDKVNGSRAEAEKVADEIVEQGLKRVRIAAPESKEQVAKAVEGQISHVREELGGRPVKTLKPAKFSDDFDPSYPEKSLESNLEAFWERERIAHINGDTETLAKIEELREQYPRFRELESIMKDAGAAGPHIKQDWQGITTASIDCDTLKNTESFREMLQASPLLKENYAQEVEKLKFDLRQANDVISNSPSFVDVVAAEKKAESTYSRLKNLENLKKAETYAEAERLGFDVDEMKQAQAEALAQRQRDLDELKTAEVFGKCDDESVNREMLRNSVYDLYKKWGVTESDFKDLIAKFKEIFPG